MVAVSSEGDGKDRHPGLRLSRGEGNRPDGNYTFSGPWTVKGKGKCPEMETELEGVLAGGDLYAARTFVDHSGRRLMWVMSTISCTRKSAEGRRMGAPPTI